MKFSLYRIECQTPEHIYVGISRRVWNRIADHDRGHGAVFTRKHGVKSVEIVAEFKTEREAKAAEWTLVLKLSKRFVVRGAGRTANNIPGAKRRGVGYLNH